MIRWAVYDEGMKIWKDGKLVGVIDPEQYPHILSDIAVYLRHYSAKKYKGYHDDG